MVAIRYWRVMDYVDHRGSNVVLDYLAGLEADPKQAINTFIQNIEVQRPPFDPRDVKKLKNKYGQNCDGFIEFRIKWNRIQYRPIAWYGPDKARREITIFGVATEKNDRFVPEGICRTCRNRLIALQRNEGHVKDHDFG